MARLVLDPASRAASQELLAFELENREWFESMIQGRKPEFYNLATVTKLLAEAEQQWTNGETYQFLVRLDGELVGRVNLRHVSKKTPFSAEIGYRIGKRSAGKGIMTKAVSMACRFAYEQLSLQRLYAKIAINNPASQIVLLKNGFNFTSRIPKAIMINGRYWDLVVLERMAPAFMVAKSKEDELAASDDETESS